MRPVYTTFNASGLGIVSSLVSSGGVPTTFDASGQQCLCVRSTVYNLNAPASIYMLLTDSALVCPPRSRMQAWFEGIASSVPGHELLAHSARMRLRVHLLDVTGQRRRIIRETRAHEARVG